MTVIAFRNRFKLHFKTRVGFIFKNKNVFSGEIYKNTLLWIKMYAPQIKKKKKSEKKSVDCCDKVWKGLW